jgi:glycosylphosphatidylinositol transamidase (GPIT) subunit GPI8
VTSTTYRHWRLHNGKFATLQYFSADGSDRTVSTINDWSVKVYNEQDLEEYVSNLTYPEHIDNYAVVVAGSSGWSNYRHQADALAMYHALKAQGFDDDHIILIIEDDIADNPRNLHPGEMRIVSDGDNLYKDLMIDYKMSSLYPADIQNIMTGVKTARTPVVLEAGENDNVFIFWSGHGEYKSLIYNEQEFTASEVRDMLETMNREKKYRKLLFVMETCFSGSVAESCEGINGILMMTAANDSETSKADMFDSELGVYLSNGFTRAFQDMIIEQPNVSLRDLFYHVVRQTAGSHASLYNYKNYGDIYSEYLGEIVCRNMD